MNTKSLGKLGLLASLYGSQFMPVWFVFYALPVFMRRQGLSLEAIGFLPLLALPVTLKFLWSPLIDRYGFTRWGHYRFWIICFQLLTASITAFCAVVSVEKNLTLLLAGFAFMCISCASQDIASDALAVGLLEPQERGLGNGVQSAGGYLGGIIGGGGMLILLDRWGWTRSLLMLSLLMVVALIPVLLHQEQPSWNDKQMQGWGDGENVQSKRANFKTFINFCRRPQMWLWLLILLLYSASSGMALAMFRPLLVDIGLSLADIGVLNGIVRDGAGMVGGIVAGFLIAPLGRRRSLIALGLLWTISTLAYLFPAFGFTSLPALYLIVISAAFALGTMVTATSTIMMDKSQPETAGTDYTFQVSVGSLGSIVASGISGVVAQAIGYRGVFALSIAIAILTVAIIAKVAKGTGFFQPNQPDLEQSPVIVND